MARILFVLAAWVLFGAGAAFAQIEDTRRRIDDQTETITSISAELISDDADLVALRDRLIGIRDMAQSFRDDVDSERADISEDVIRLGDPIDGEADVVSLRRRELERQLEMTDSALAQAELNVDQANRLLAEIAEQRRVEFYESVFRRSPPPLAPAQLEAAGASFVAGAEQAWAQFRAWIKSRQEMRALAWSFFVLGLAMIFTLVMTLPARRWISGIVTAPLHELDPLPSRKIILAAANTVSRAAPAVIGGFALYETARILGFVTADSLSFARAIWLGFIAVALVEGASLGVLSPRHENWRIAQVGGSAAAFIRLLLVLAAIVLWADASLTEGARIFDASPELSVLQFAVSATALAVILIALTRSALWKRPEPPAADGDDAGAPDAAEEPARRRPTPLRALRVGLTFLAVLSIIAVLAGYVSLAHFALTRIFFTGGVFALAWFVRALLREGVRALDARFSSRRAGQDSEPLTFFWIGVLIDGVVWLSFLPPVLLLFGADWTDVSSIASRALLGFQIGPVEISIVQVLAAAAVFVLLLAITRFIQRTAETRVFPRTRMDAGVQNSLKTLIGYVGLIIAFMTGVGMLGFNLSNLAIIAGALSVGIGFGLQSIVNNFVSGLILLFERPIKVGDWIVTGSGEGIVKRISVRSTEIETFDRSSLIIPNSELISGTVVNWTHKNRLGRITVPVGVSYNEDPERILELLKSVPDDVDGVLSYPAPLILMTGFGDSSLDFEVRAYIPDIESSLSARTRLRIAIFKTFKEAGVEIPFPQRDLHVRSADAELVRTFGGVSPDQRPVRQAANGEADPEPET